MAEPAPTTTDGPGVKAAGPSRREIPPGDDRERLVCPDCGFIAYENPKIVVGSVVTYGDRVLLCRRAIDPRRGFWTLPAGYMELNESTEEGARREAWEEARARITLNALLAVYNIPRINQVQLIYRASLDDPAVSPGPETEAIRLVPWRAIPWDDLAFPTVAWALNEHARRQGQTAFAPGTNPVRNPGIAPQSGSTPQSGGAL